MGAAKWAAMKELERSYPGISVEHVEFEVVEERADDQDGGPLTRVVAAPDLDQWQAAEDEFDWPDEPTERVREILRRVVSALGLRASVDITQRDGEIWAEISGPELGLLIGKHGQTLDALQSICMQAAFRGSEDRQPVVVDAGRILVVERAVLRVEVHEGDPSSRHRSSWMAARAAAWAGFKGGGRVGRMCSPA